MFQGWVMLEPDAVPERWRDRARLVALVPLLPGEHVSPALDPAAVSGEDPRLLRLLAQGRATDAIARELRISARTVQRAVARLRRRYGVATKAELSAVLSRAGF